MFGKLSFTGLLFHFLMDTSYISFVEVLHADMRMERACSKGPDMRMEGACSESPDDLYLDCTLCKPEVQVSLSLGISLCW